jgi:bifunctional DNA-binding transcriptional regulator/antitoxin component of YhaV-PrlF toxin-antitoxin module
MMFFQTLRQVDDEYLITIPDEVVEQLGLVEGQVVELRIEPFDETMLPEAVMQAFERSWKRSEAAYRYLSGR